MLLARVRKTLTERRILSASDRHVLVACSGGPDSTAMVHVLHRLREEWGIALTVASVDHGLRLAAQGEVAAVGRFAAELGLPFRALRVSVPSGSSVQGRARQVRYQALREAARDVGATTVAVGHTRDDQAETVLGRLLRGASVEGLAGIAPRRGDGVIRPLLDASREEVRSYVHHHRLPTVKDPSNEDARFLRVRIRHELIPHLTELDSNVVDHLADLADDSRSLRRRSRADGKRLLDTSVSVGGELDRQGLMAAPETARRAALRVWVKRRTGRLPTRAQLLALDRAASQGRGEVALGRGVRVSAGSSCLRFDAAPVRFDRSPEAHRP